jgi:hypothetical protein
MNVQGIIVGNEIRLSIEIYTLHDVDSPRHYTFSLKTNEHIRDFIEFPPTATVFDDYNEYLYRIKPTREAGTISGNEYQQLKRFIEEYTPTKYINPVFPAPKKEIFTRSVINAIMELEI